MSLTKIRRLLLKYKLTLATLAILLPIYILLYQIYIPRINAFGCFDDCNNFMRGYFFLNGNPLFSGVFSGHQPFGSYLSAIIQAVTDPASVYELILRHRQFLIGFSFIANILLILRFGPKMIIFTVIFEFSKFYIFGDRFLGESMIIYPAVYMAGLGLYRIWGRKIYRIEYAIAAVFCWFVIFLRATYVPMALFLFIFINWHSPIRKMPKGKVASIALFFALSLVTILLHDIPEYFFNVVFFNFQVNIPAETRLPMFGPKILHWFFYPIYIFFYGEHNIFKSLLIGINITFLILFVNLLYRKRLIMATFLFLLLGVANIRTVMPGNLFLEAFHMVSWYGLLIFITLMLLFDRVENKKLFYPGALILVVSFAIFLASPDYFAKEKVDPHVEFVNNYGYILQQGEAIKALSNPDDSLFLDGSDDLIYWQSGLFSSYKYSWYTSSMSKFDKFNIARIEMFENDPPDFYREYGRCPKGEGVDAYYFLPTFIKDDYVRLYEDDHPSCLYIHKNKLSEVTTEQKEKAAEWLYTISDEKN